MVRIRRVLICFVMAVLLAYACVHFVQIRRQLQDAETVIAGLRQESEQLRTVNQALRREIERRDDASALEDLARQQLGLVLPADRIYVADDANREEREGNSWIWK